MDQRTDEWFRFIPTHLMKTVQASILSVASRISEPTKLAELSENASNQAGSTPWRRWAADSVGTGPTAGALFFDQLDRCFPNQGFDAIAHRHLEYTLTALAPGRSTPTTSSLGLHSGLAGLSYVVHLRSRGGQRYRGLLSQLDETFLRSMDSDLSIPPSTASLQWGSYDVISGDAGILRYTIARRDDERFAEMSSRLIRRLVHRWRNMNSPNGFYLTPDDLPTDYHKQRFPHGYIDLGFAHGIPGVLAALSLATMAGFNDPDVLETIRGMSDFILQHRMVINGLSDWPMGIDFIQHHELAQSKLAWCYGPVGVAASLFLASRALSDVGLNREALDMLSKLCANRVLLESLQENPILCHGLGGVLQICLRIFRPVPDEQSKSLIILLVSSLLARYEPESPTGYFDVEFSGRVYCPSLLNGSIGVALAQMSLLPNTGLEWDQLLLLS